MTTIIHDPGNKQPIRTLYAFLSCDENGNEGIIAMANSNGWMSLVTGDLSVVDRLRCVAHDVARKSNKKVRLVKFSSRETIEEIG